MKTNNLILAISWISLILSLILSYLHMYSDKFSGNVELLFLINHIHFIYFITLALFAIRFRNNLA